MNVIELPLYMTSNNTPEPFSASATVAGTTAWKAFDGNATGTAWGDLPGVSDHYVTLSLGRTYHIFRWQWTTHNGNIDRNQNIYLYGSNDGTAFTSLHSTSKTWSGSWWTSSAPITTKYPGYKYLRVRIQTTSASAQPSRFGETRFFIAESDIAGDIYDTDIYTAYYVSQQNGNDDNDGRTPQTAWATIDKALCTAKANPISDTYVYIGPGVYGKSNTDILAVWHSGLDSSHRIIFKGDPDCLFLTEDKPGRVVITDELDTAPYYKNGFIYFLNKEYIEFDNIDFVSTQHSYAILGSPGTNGQVIRNCRVWSNSHGCLEITSMNSTVLSKYNCFEMCNSYNSVALGSNESTSYAGFSGGTSYNCLAALCNIGYLNNTSYNSEAWLCSSIATGGSATNCLASQCYVTSLPTGWTGTMCGQTSASVINTSPLVVQKLNLINTLRTGLADWGYNLSTIPDAMIDIDGIVRNSGTADIGPWELADYGLEYEDFYLNKPALKISGHNQLIFDLPVKANQEITKSVYVKWFEPDTQNIRLNASMTANDTPEGYIVDSSSYSVGYEPWKAFDASGTSTYWSAIGELPQWISYEFPSDVIVNKYVLSIPTNAQSYSPKDFTFEAWNGSDWVVLDSRSGVTWASAETKTFDFENETAYTKYRLVISAIQSSSILNIYNLEIYGTLVREKIDDDLKPQFKVEGLGIEETRSCTVDRNQWEKLSITFTPLTSGVMTVRLISRNHANGSYVIFSDPE